MKIKFTTFSSSSDLDEDKLSESKYLIRFYNYSNIYLNLNKTFITEKNKSSNKHGLIIHVTQIV